MAISKSVYPAAILIIAAVYLAAAKLGLSLADPSLAEQVTIVWPPAGIALVVMLLFGYRFWPAITLGAFLANIWTNETILTAGGIAVGNTLEGIIGAWLLRRVVRFDTALERLKDVVGLVVLAAGIVYLVVPTDRLPSFMGQIANLTGHRSRRGFAGVVGGAVLLIGGSIALARS